MAIDRQRRSLSYGLSQALLGIPAAPIVSSRAPTTSDKAEIGSTWINKSTNIAYVLTSIVANSATWGSTTSTGTAAVVASLTATTGNITATLGDIVATAGDVTVSAGDIDVTLGDIDVDAGNITATLGSLEAGTTVVAGTGVTATTGGVLVSAGDVAVTLGNITADAGNVTATLGAVTGVSVASTEDVTAGRSLFVSGDEGTGIVSTTAFTNVVDTAVSTGAGKVLMKTANAGDSEGWLKFYDGTTVRWLPYWSNISPT